MSASTLKENASCDFSQLFPEMDSPDFCIVTSDSSEFRVHRGVLAAHSKVFEAMFGMENAKENLTGRCNVDDVDGETMRNLLRFIYKVYDPKSYVEKCNAAKLLVAADKYDLELLVPMCAKTMAHNMTEESVGTSLILGDRYQILKLKEMCLEFISDRFASLVGTGQLEIVRLHDQALMQDVVNHYSDYLSKHRKQSETLTKVQQNPMYACCKCSSRNHLDDDGWCVECDLDPHDVDTWRVRWYYGHGPEEEEQD